jgi:hypothetical protein
LLGSLAAHATDYYVSPSGLDRNAGTSNSPWQSIAKVNSTGLRAGDRVLFEGGQTFTGKLSLSASEIGTAASPIVITSFGSGRATINAGSGDGLSAYNTAGYRIANLNFVGAGSTVNTGNGIVFYTDLAGNVKLDYLQIDNVDISGFGGGAIIVGSYNGTTGFQNVSITYAVIHDNTNGISTWGFASTSATAYSNRNFYLGHCTVYNNMGAPGKSVSSGSGIVISDVDGGKIERSVAYNNGTLSTSNGGPVGIWAYNSNSVVIQYNESYSNHTASVTDGGGFDLDGGMTNSVLQYNYSHDNDGPGFLYAQYTNARPFSGNVIRYNISQNDARKNSAGAIRVWNGGSGIQNSDIYGNTIFVAPTTNGYPPALLIDTPTSNVHIRNNIFLTTGGLPVTEIASGQAVMLLQGNDYWSSGAQFSMSWAGQNYDSLIDWKTASGQENVNGAATGLNVDPKLSGVGTAGPINNSDGLSTLTSYKLLAGSPLIGRGVDLLSLMGVSPGPTDFWGGKIPGSSGYDVGANSFISVQAVNQAPVVSAGSNMAITLPATATLRGTVSDDGLPSPPAAVSTTWQQTSGPAMSAI